VQRSLGKPDAALASYNEALRLEQEIADKKGAADTLLDMGQLAEDRGQPDKALQLYKQSLQMERETGDESNQALCQNNIANVYLAKGQNDDALTYYQQALQLREKLGVSADIAETLHNLGEGYAQTGQFDDAVSSYMKALQLRRTANDNRGAALDSHGMGMVFVAQGRYGAAVTSLQDATKGFRDLGDRTRAMAEILTDYGSALALSGRGSDAGKILEEAQGLARVLKNDTVLADILNAQGDVQAYQGNLKAAKDLYQRGLQSASNAKAQKEIVLSTLNLGRVAIAEGQAQSASASLRPLSGHAQSLGLKALSLQCSVALAEALVKGKDYTHARPQLEQLLGLSDKLGSRMETARIQYLLGNSLRLEGKESDGASHYREVVRILDEIKKEPGAQDLLQRADLKALYDDAARWATSKI
jgi:tetratricopeptide (TPR) repeat protein